MAKKDNKGKSTVTVFTDWCKGCGLCAAFCPANVIERDEQGKAVIARESECIHCGFCELHCPDFAIVVREKETDGDDNPKQESQPPREKV